MLEDYLGIRRRYDELLSGSCQELGHRGPFSACGVSWYVWRPGGGVDGEEQVA